MLGGLYGDLPPPTTTTTDDSNPTSSTPSSTSVWSSSVKMAPPTLRKPSTYTPPPSLLRPHPNKPKPPCPPVPLSPDIPSPPRHAGPAFVSVAEEYDPARPNDYEDYRRDKKKKTREAELKKELERRQLEEEERERERERIGNISNASDVVSGEEAWRRRAAMSGASPVPPRSPSPPVPQPNSAGGEGGFSIEKSDVMGLGVGAGGQMTAAQRMMAKMGWKAGQGLGRQEQGITTPLMAKKTDRRAGVIVNASETKLQQQQQQQDKKVKGVNFNGPPTRVLLLRNMVGPGEVDDELEDEVASECAKYGTVTRVLIFEITEPNFPSNEAVRIFVQFERSESTTKAFVDLDGRFFGGRVVRAAFYDEERFGKNELAPLPGEVAGF